LSKILNTFNILVDATIETGSGNNMRIEYNLQVNSRFYLTPRQRQFFASYAARQVLQF
jgi:hypothetical protein